MKEANDSRTVTRKWNTVNNHSNPKYSVRNDTIFSTQVLKSNLCDFNDAYILVRGNINIYAAPATPLTFQNCAPCSKCITKINQTKIG